MAKAKPKEINELDHSQIYGEDPESHYRWVAEGTLSYRKRCAQGYVAVKKDEGIEAPYMDEGRADGIVGNRGTILMKCRKEEYEARQAAKVKENTERLNRTTDSFLEGALSRGEITERQAESMRRRGVVER